MGDQPGAIAQLADGLMQNKKYQTLLGATGTGKTFTMAKVIEKVQRPTLVISHNKTLAAQLYEEFRELFPHNSVNYFVSFYDYYQPEAYIPARDIYIEKDSARNDNLDRLRLAATAALVGRQDVIVVASVSCIYGIGSPWDFAKAVLNLTRGQVVERKAMLAKLTELQYQRNDMHLERGKFRVRGDVVEVWPGSEEYALRLELFGDELDRIRLINPLTGETLAEQERASIYPAVQYVLPEERRIEAIGHIKDELKERVAKLRFDDKLLEAERLQARCRYDIEMLEQTGFCSGIENYSRHLDGRAAGSRPWTLMDYFQFAGKEAREARDAKNPDREGGDGIAPSLTVGVPSNTNTDWLFLVDESHVTLPQMRAMWHGDRNRKTTLVEHGFRLPSALDNRPMTFDEIENLWPQVVFVSATPADYELEKSAGEVVEQVIRPTGLIDPVIEIRPAATQVPDLLEEVKKRIAAGERSIVTTLTKRLAEDLAAYLEDAGIATRYLHSDVETLDRVQILRELRQGTKDGGFDVLVGVNLLREGLDLPEVSFVGILDADKEGFLRSGRSLIQQIGRAARNANAFVVFYADKVTPAMQQAMDETTRRRTLQLAYNQAHGITPKTVEKAIRHGIEMELRGHETARAALTGKFEAPDAVLLSKEEQITELERAMVAAADALQFEKAAQLRDQWQALKAGGTGKLEKAKPKPGKPGVKRKFK